MFQLWIIDAINIGIFSIGVYLLSEFPAFVVKLIEARSMLVAVFGTFLLGPIWGAYARLSVFDKLDHLDLIQRREIIRNVRESRKGLLALFFYSVAFCAIGFISLLAADSVNEFKKAIWWVMPAMLAFFISALRRIIGYFLMIENDREKIAELQRREEARRKLIERINKDRSENPMPLDEHLSGYRLVKPTQ